MFKQTIVTLLVVSASAEMFSADRRKGRSLLKNAKIITPSRFLQNENYYNGNQAQQGENGWNQYEYEAEYELNLAGLSIKYMGCSEWMGVDAEWEQEQMEQQMQYYYQNQQNQQNQAQDGQQQNYQEQQQQNYQQQQEQQNYQNMQEYNDGLQKNSLVRFTLCSDQSCGSCSGEFAVDMIQFVDAYTESKMDALEYQCEMIREHCYCSSGNWEQCFYDCYQQAEFDLYGSNNGDGVQYCLDQYYGQESFQLQAYLECQEMEQVDGQDEQQQQQYQNQQNGGGNYNYNWQQEQQQDEQQQFFIGPYCKDNKYIHLGAFYDEDCSYPASNAKFKSQSYGSSFPYFKESIIKPNECVICEETETYYQLKMQAKQAQYYANQANNQNYNGNGQANYEYAQWYENDYGDANEVCGGSFEDAIKCDKNRGYYSGCSYLEDKLPQLDGRGSLGVFDNSGLYEKFKRNKNVAIVMGVIAALLLGALAFMCGLCGAAGDPKKIALLEQRRMGDIA